MCAPNDIDQHGFRNPVIRTGPDAFVKIPLHEFQEMKAHIAAQGIQINELIKELRELRKEREKLKQKNAAAAKSTKEEASSL